MYRLPKYPHISSQLGGKHVKNPWFSHVSPRCQADLLLPTFPPWSPSDSNSCWRSPSASAWQSRNLVASSIHNKWTTWHAFHVFPRIMLYNVIYIYVCIYICIVHPEIRKSNAMFRDSLFAPHSWGSGRPRLTHGAAAQAVHSTHKLRRDVCEKMYLWLCQNSYWKWPFIVSFPINSMVIFHSYVNDYQRVTCKKSSKRPAKTSSCPLFLGFWIFLGRLLPVLLPIRQGSGFSHGTLCDTHINISQGMPCHSSLKHGNNNKKCHVTFATPRLPHFMTWIKTAAGELDQKKKLESCSPVLVMIMVNDNCSSTWNG